MRVAVPHRTGMTRGQQEIRLSLCLGLGTYPALHSTALRDSKPDTVSVDVDKTDSARRRQSRSTLRVSMKVHQLTCIPQILTPSDRLVVLSHFLR